MCSEILTNRESLDKMSLDKIIIRERQNHIQQEYLRNEINKLTSRMCADYLMNIKSEVDFSKNLLKINLECKISWGNFGSLSKIDEIIISFINLNNQEISEILKEADSNYREKLNQLVDFFKITRFDHRIGREQE